ncbi:mechanosensitive ion channel family protein [Brevibacillus fulvus]|uniref:Small conductance mechanosensitive channel n=1 Tax=Brevibacillus fulvus TaxID=1125967 RepID=A0A939BSX0_9BACL|nr:mechanosensitive ion channel domain-containing protein [Brevibacillus fulvus]MBM7588919.1 small conductance mechanosensitive channel [Brevibacillus fulvus]
MEALSHLSLQQYFTWAFWSPYLSLVMQRSFTIVIILLLTWLALKIRKILIGKIFQITRLDEKQENTLESLLLSLTRYVIVIIAMVMILSNIGISVGPIIASAGVLGLAVGFGAQTLVKDLITGFFIIFEDQFSVGDYVSINNGQITGTVESVGLRATKIRTFAQHVVVIQNSEIKISQNYNRERMRAVVHVNVPYEIDPADVEQAVQSVSIYMQQAHPEYFIRDENGEFLEPPQLYGITDVENNALGAKYTVTSLVSDQYYFTCSKELRSLLLKELKAAGVSISYPRMIGVPHITN